MMQASLTGNSEAVLLLASEEETIIASSETMPASKALAILAVTLGVDPDELQEQVIETYREFGY